MPNYENEIVNKLLDRYEKRKAIESESVSLRAITIGVSDIFPAYLDQYNHSCFRDVNAAIALLVDVGLVSAKMDNRGYYDRIRLRVENVSKAYAKVRRVPKKEAILNLTEVLTSFNDSDTPIIQSIVRSFTETVNQFKKLPYDIGLDADRLKKVLSTIDRICHLNSETYVRNFSLAVFHDSKEFQNHYRSTVQSILFDFSDTVLEKNRILELFNLYDNPTFVYLKGNAFIYAEQTEINLSSFRGGISLPESALDNISGISVQSRRVITVENLTTYHDTPDDTDLYIYLGGFHNRSKEALLKRIYQANPGKEYFHEGDIDVFGFAILKSLRERTQISFLPLNMDVETLDKYYREGLYKPLTAKDKSIITSGALDEYKPVLDFMLEHDCKVEQESIVASSI